VAVGEASAATTTAVAQAWLDARNAGDLERTQSLSASDVRLRRAEEDWLIGAAAIGAALEGEPADVVALVPDGPYATATMSFAYGFETWRLRLVDGFISEIVIDPDPLA
jgi:hypothetical protein